MSSKKLLKWPPPPSRSSNCFIWRFAHDKSRLFHSSRSCLRFCSLKFLDTICSSAANILKTYCNVSLKSADNHIKLTIEQHYKLTHLSSSESMICSCFAFLFPKGVMNWKSKFTWCFEREVIFWFLCWLAVFHIKTGLSRSY